MTIDKQALRKRYSEKPTPKCDICGAKMTIQRMSGSRVTYGCSGAIYDETGCHYAEGRSLADDHYEQSRVTVTDESDPDVLALLDELEAAKKRNAELEARTPYGYLRQCDGQVQISIGSERPHNRSGGYATPWFAIYTAAGIGKGE